MTTSERRMWLTAGWLAIAYVVVTFAVSPAYASVVTGIGDSPGDARKALVTSSAASGYLGAYGELLAVLILLAGGLLTARLLRGTGEVTGWLSSCMSDAVYEVKEGFPFSGSGVRTGAPADANSICAYNGLNDMNPDQGPIGSIVQTPHNQGAPGDAGHGTCAGGSNPENP